MLKINTQFLSTIKYRFDAQLSESDILDWLYNFEEEDWNSALILLNNVSYYSENRCCNILESGLKSILNHDPHLPIVFYPIGGVGKSGGVMAYYIKKIIGRFHVPKWCFAHESYDFKGNPHVIILLDDFLGSGNSAKKLFIEISNNPPPKGSKYYCLCVALMQKAKNLLEELSIDVFGDVHLPAFARRHSVFGYPHKMNIIRDFALKYGNLLYPKRKYTVGMNLYIGPLGYANSQSLICFEHTTPNNTLPIIWESKKRVDNRVRWVPLFPRRLFDRVQRDTTFERLKYKWLSISQKISGGKIIRLFNDYSKDSLHLLGLLHCRYYHRSNSYTCNLLEITVDEFEKLKEKAINQGLITDNLELSQLGRISYERIRKYDFKKDPLIEMSENDSNFIYLPKEFLGLSKNDLLAKSEE